MATAYQPDVLASYPICDEDCGVVALVPNPLPLKPVFEWDRAKPAVIMLAVLLLSYGVFYWWARRHGKYRISDLSKIGSQLFTWVAVSIMIGLFFLTWHLIYGGPL